MDIISHAMAGASVGVAFGHPVAGAIFGVLPDLVLLTPKRLAVPPARYKASHSMAFVAGAGLLGWLAFGTVAAPLALLSHILLDLPTHGALWGPQLLYPFSLRVYNYGEEWEWFNRSWWQGLGLTFLWSLLWLFGTLI